MKPYIVLQAFKGSQTGNDGPFHFEPGEPVMLSDHLAEVALKEGYVKPAEEAIAMVPTVVADMPESREMKVTGPEETKPKKAGKTKAA